MKSIVFDASSLISIVTNDLLWTLGLLKNKFQGEFLIPASVKKELIDSPIENNRFKFEAVRLQGFIEHGVLGLRERIDVAGLLNNINRIYKANGEFIRIMHYGEVEALALAVQLKADAYVVDERTMRWLIEDPEALRQLLESKLHTPVTMDIILVRNFKAFSAGVRVLRSIELMMVAYELGLFEEFVTKQYGSKALVEGILWGLRLNGCAISTEEINDLVRLETR